MSPRGSRRFCGEYASLLGEADVPNSLDYSHHSLQATYDKTSHTRCAVSRTCSAQAPPPLWLQPPHCCRPKQSRSAPGD